MREVQNSVAKSQADFLGLAKKERRPVSIILDQLDRAIQRLQPADGHLPPLLFIHQRTLSGRVTIIRKLPLRL